MAGQVGVAGLHAPIHVEEVLKNGSEAVQILAHNMVAILAQGPPSWYDRAISSPVPVRNIAVCILFYNRIYFNASIPGNFSARSHILKFWNIKT